MAVVVYLDICCLKRPFDDQRPTPGSARDDGDRGARGAGGAGSDSPVRSPAHVFENDRNPREDRRLATTLWLDGAHLEVALTDRAASRAQRLVDLGFGALDALHTSFAEAAGAVCLATTDDRLIALGQRHRETLRVEIVNPTFLLERLTRDAI